MKTFARHEIAEDRIEEALEFALGLLNTIDKGASGASAEQLGALACAGIDLAVTGPLTLNEDRGSGA